MGGKYLVGLDIGTTAIKGIIIDDYGNLYASARVEYTLETNERNWCELDPEIYWISTQMVLHKMLAQVSFPADEIASIAFSSQGETLIPIDKTGNPLRKAIVWMDNRSEKEAKQIEADFGKTTVYNVTGQPEILPTWPATKILWLKRNERAVYNKVFKYLLVADFLVAKLTGQYVTEYSLVSSTLYFNFRKRIWWDDMLKYLGLSPEHLPSLVSSGTAVGTVTKEAARVTGLNEKTLVVVGAYDHPAGAIGAGNIVPGIISETTGGAMAMCVTLDKPVLDRSLNLPCHCHAVNDKYFLLPYGQTAGMVLKWFRDNFAEIELQKSQRDSIDSYDLLTEQAAKVPPGCEGLTMLPHLMGTGSPEFDLKAKGIFYGITLNMTRGYFVRAILEAIACMVKANVDPLLSRGFSIKEIRALGGGAKSELWNQIKADMLNIPYVSLRNRETPSLGAAILAGVGCGIFSDIHQGCGRVVKTDKKFSPDPGKKEIYRQVYERYQMLYKINKPLWD